MNPASTLSQSRGAEASDSRDKIYSMTGLFTEDFAKGLIVDYSNSNTTVKTFVSFAEHCIRYGLGTHLLEQTGLPQALKDLPSWVTDLIIKLRPGFSLSYQTYKSAGSTKTDIAVANCSPGAISASGWIIGEVYLLGLAYSYSSFFSPIPQDPDIKNQSGAVAALETNAYFRCTASCTENFLKTMALHSGVLHIRI